MARFYLARYVGSGTDADPYRPSGADLAAEWSSIDLRPDPTVTDGYALLRVPAPLPNSPQRVTLTDDLDDASTTLRDRISSRLGLNVDQLPFRRMVMHLLFDHGDDANVNRWNRLRPSGWQYEVWLGELLHTMPYVAGASSITESFDKADSSTLGPDLTWTEVVGDLVIVSNTARDNQAVNGDVSARAESDLATTDHYASADVTWLQATSTAGGTCVRFASAATTYYRGSGHRSLGQDRIHKIVTGTATQLATQAHTIGAGALNVRTEANGSTISVLVAGAASLPVTDTAITTGTRTGIGGNAVTSAVRYQWDNFAAGDLGGAEVFGTISTTFTLTATAVGTPTVLGTATQTFTLSATAVGTKAVAGAVSTSFALTATAQGTKTVAGASTQTFTLTATAVGTKTVGGAVATVFTITATAAGTPTVSGTVSSTFTLTAVAVATRSVFAVISTTFTLTATATSAVADVNATSTSTVTAPTSTHTARPTSTTSTLTVAAAATSTHTISDG